MALLPAHGYLAEFSGPDGERHTEPLICWWEDGTHVFGMVLHRGSPRRAEQIPGFLRYRAHQQVPTGTSPVAALN
ncbi:DUF6253 family protein [Kitasatospora sp. GP82]|uniref:DUF6253 family protein n=1 Tax=Kitasatospora sp. GP82 TaxID=3035089 RepID=UPI002474ADE4|nr:DUF6253 family protein [Kitasatospora sp. GP82]MDH6128155.1 hypothetical protein [Kitasatospora sp. GP82]